MFGASGEILPPQGELSVSLSARALHSDDHYNGIEYQRQRERLGTYVVNEQKIVDVTTTYAITRRLSASLGIPYVNSSWSIPTPISGPGEREEQNGSGIGDIMLSGRYWLFDPERHATGNISVGVGCKAPTGGYDQVDGYPDLLTGVNDRSKVVDQSVQPGDGGWGISFELQGFRRMGRAVFFGSGLYLANPKDTNGADSIIVGLGFGGNPSFADLLENSVPDSYLLRTGVTYALGAGWAASAAFRMEGLPRYDLIGDSHGFRRPGYETFFEPGIIYSTARSTWSLHMPWGLVRNRQANAYTGFPGDATFPDYIILAGYSYRFDASALRAPAAP